SLEDLELEGQGGRVDAELAVHIGVAARLEPDVPLLRVVGELPAVPERDDLVAALVHQPDARGDGPAGFGVDNTAEDRIAWSSARARGDAELPADAGRGRLAQEAAPIVVHRGSPVCPPPHHRSGARRLSSPRSEDPNAAAVSKARSRTRKGRR